MISESTATAPPKKYTRRAEATLSLGLFLLALLPRAYDLHHFVTADEAKWVYRSAQFLVALLNSDFAATSVNLTPAVTTTWLGSLGLTCYHWLNQASLNLPFTEWLLAQPPFRTDMPTLVATRWPMVLFTSLSVVLIYWLIRLLFGRSVALLAAVFISLGPHTVALSRIIGHDAPVALFMMMSILFLLIAIQKYNDPQQSSISQAPIPQSPISNLLKRSGSFKPQSPNPAKPEPKKDLFFKFLPNVQEIHWLGPKLQILFPIILSGLTAGLALLSKAPAFFLIPFVGLVLLVQVWSDKPNLFFWLKMGLLWLGVAYLTFVIVWPAAWLEPVGRPWAVIQNAFLSATDTQEAGHETFWLVPNLGSFYYLVHTSFKLSPLVMLGLFLTLIFIILPKLKQLSQSPPPILNPSIPSSPNYQSPNSLILRQSPGQVSNLQKYSTSPTLWLLIFITLFTIFMTLGGKRSPRYILPIFPALAIIAARGWQEIARRISTYLNLVPHPTSHIPRPTFLIILTLIALLILIPYRPYYLTYFNPLLGGSYTAPQWVKLGWGEGLDHVGRFLQREHPGSRVGTPYASTVAPFFKGKLSSLTSDRLDYVVLYQKQVQSGNPAPEFITYYQQSNPVFSVVLNGITYADVYPGPAIQPTDQTSPQTPVIGFRPASPYARIGAGLTIDLVWQSLPDDTVATITMAPLSALENGDTGRGTWNVERGAKGMVARVDDTLITSRHMLTLPQTIERGEYMLLVNGQPLGPIEARRFVTPDTMTALPEIPIFDHQIALTGYQLGPGEDFIAVNLAWQSLQAQLPDYTVFVQLIDDETQQRVAGFDSQPGKGQWPTSHWVEDEVVIDKHLIAVPYELPAGYYTVIVGLYQPETGQRLLWGDGQDYWMLPWSLRKK